MGTHRRATGREGHRPATPGFTLVELLVVTVVLGLLGGAVVMAVRGIADRGVAASCAQDRRVLAAAEEAYFARQGRYASQATLVAAGFLEGPSTRHDVLPADPVTSYAIVPGSECAASAAVSTTLPTTTTTSVSPVAVSDAFAGTGTLAGSSPQIGVGPWSVRSGTFTRVAGRVTNGGGADRWATVPTGTLVQRVTVGVADLPATHTVGVVAKASSSATTYLRAVKSHIGSGRLQIQRVVGGTATTLATLTGIGNPSSGTLVLIVNGASVTAGWNASSVSATLSAADQTTFGPLTHAGLYVSGTRLAVFQAPFRVEIS